MKTLLTRLMQSLFINSRTLMTMMVVSGSFLLNDAFGQATDTSTSCASGADVGSTNCSFAAGEDATVSADNATAVSGAEASGEGSFAASPFSTASGIGASALSGGTASGGLSVAVGGGNATGSSSISIGSNSSASGTKSFSIGQGSVTGDYSYSIGKENVVGGECTWTFGEYLRTSSIASHNMVIGHGNFQSSQLLENDISNSIMIGVNSSEPTMFFEDAGGGSGIGRVGIGTTDPDGLLHLLDEDGVNTDLVIERGSNITDGRLVFQDEGGVERAYVAYDDNENLLIRNSDVDEDIVFNISDNGTNTEVMRVRGATSRVGIGTDSPNTRLHVEAADIDGDDEPIARFTVSDNSAGLFQIENRSSEDNEFCPALIGIGTDDAESALYIRASLNGSLTDNGSVPVMTFDTRIVGNDPVVYRPIFQWSNDSDKHMTMLANGSLGVGTTSPLDLLHVNGGACKPSTNTWTICSDENLKTDISEFTDGLDILREIDPIWFRYNGIGGLPTEPLTPGVIAQQVMEVAPYMIDSAEMVIDTATNETMSVLTYNANALFYLLLNSVKELDQRTEQLAQLSDQMSSLTNSYTELENQYNGLNQAVAYCCASQEASFKQDGDYAVEEKLKSVGSIRVHPNPFQNETMVSYSIGAAFTTGVLIILDSSGKMVYQIPIRDNQGSVAINSNDLAIGTYFCSLIVDGVNVGATRIVRIK